MLQRRQHFGDKAAARWLVLLRYESGGAGAEYGRQRRGSGFDDDDDGGYALSCPTKSHRSLGPHDGGTRGTHERTCGRRLKLLKPRLAVVQWVS